MTTRTRQIFAAVAFAATVAAYPTEDATIVVLSNIEGAQVRRIQEELAQILFQVP